MVPRTTTQVAWRLQKGEGFGYQAEACMGDESDTGVEEPEF